MAIVNQQLKQEFQKRYKTLPEDIQRALTAVASVDTIFAIGKKHGLMVDQIGKMADEIWKVMLGLANPKDFIRNLASALGIEPEKASAIASEVNAQMFQLVRESLRRIYDATAQGGAPLVSAKEEDVARSTYHVAREEKKEEEKQDTGYRIQDTKPQVSPMIYPQDRFEKEYKKEPMENTVSSSTYHAARGKEEKKEELEQLTPPPPKARGGEEELLYPEKTKEVLRESTKGREYQGGDPYRESIE